MFGYRNAQEYRIKVSFTLKFIYCLSTTSVRGIALFAVAVDCLFSDKLVQGILGDIKF